MRVGNMFRAIPLTILFLHLIHGSNVWALPKCPGIFDPNTWHNCEGVYEHEDAFYYAGEFQNGKYHGKGASSRMSGDKYVGEWKDGYKHGVGVMRTPQGDVWVGQWRYNNWLGGKQYGKKEVPPHIMTLFVKN